jgi:DNA (cytosine-5)-methyltransferase 1
MGSIFNFENADVPDHDLLTYSFPCQDLSLQGKRKGLYEGKTSSLL